MIYPDHWRQMCNPAWGVSRIRDGFEDLWARVAPSPFGRTYRLVRPFTVCGACRLRNLYNAVIAVHAQQIPGDLVECGVGRGGALALMGLASKTCGAYRTIWAFDTFAGLPAPSVRDPDFEIAKRYTKKCCGRLIEVRRFFEEVGILELAQFVPGRLEVTLPESSVQRIAVLHIDCDWYDSVKASLECLYDRVSPGGIVQIDDYGTWLGAKKAVDEFLEHKGVTHQLKWIDDAGRRLVKLSR